jgi:hypothetical protein
LKSKINLLEKKSEIYSELYKNCENNKPSPKRILLGAEIGSNFDLDLTYKINLSFQNQKGNINKVSIQRINSENYFLIGKEISIIKFK